MSPLRLLPLASSCKGFSGEGYAAHGLIRHTIKAGYIPCSFAFSVRSILTKRGGPREHLLPFDPPPSTALQQLFTNICKACDVSIKRRRPGGDGSVRVGGICIQCRKFSKINYDVSHSLVEHMLWHITTNYLCL